MTNGFKKIAVSKPRSVGERLRSARLRRKLTLTELEGLSKVRAFFIEAMEASAFDKLPATVYCLGFLRAICQVLNVPYQRFEGEFRKEQTLWLKIHTTSFDHHRLIRAHRPKTLITPKLIALGSALATVLAVTGYFYVQLATFLSPPLLEIIEPGTEAKLGSDEVQVVGKTSEGATVTINQESVVPGPDGHFSQAISLEQGINELEVSAQTRFGRQTTKQIKILRERSEAHHEADETNT